MSISAVSSATNSASYSANNTNELAQLEKQEATLEKQLQEANQSKDDPKTKQQ